MSNLQNPPPATAESGSQRLIAIGLVCLTVIGFTVIDVCAKWLSPRIGVLETTWFRYVAAFIMVFAFLNPWRVPDLLKSQKPGLQLLRGLCLLASTVLNFFALQYLQLAETVSIMFVAPLLVSLLAGPLLGEWPGPRRLVAIFIGFAGVLIVTRPGMGIVHPAALLSLTGTFCYAVLLLITRNLSATDSTETTMFYSSLAGAVVLFPIIFWVWVAPASWREWAAIILCALGGVVGHWLLIQAQRRAPAQVLAPFLYTQIIWMLASGYLFFNQMPDVWTFIGGGIVVASGLYLLHRERVRMIQSRVIE